jgi:hypothetical protein
MLKKRGEKGVFQIQFILILKSSPPLDPRLYDVIMSAPTKVYVQIN